MYKNSHSYDFYLETHPVLPGNTLGAGKPLDVDTIADMVEYFAEKHKEQGQIHGRIPANLLYCQWDARRKLLVWYNQPQARQMYFAPELEIPNGIANQPWLLYVADGKKLSVYALAEAPTDGAVLYRAPYHNVGAEGGVCLGSARVKAPAKPTYAAQLAMWEQLFWQSNFTHNTHGSAIKGNLNSYWASAVGSGKVFPTEILYPVEDSPTTVGELLKELE